MGIFLAIIITIIVFLGIIATFIYYAEPYIREVILKAVDVACYLDTYHYDKKLEERIKIGQDKFFNALFDEFEQTERKRKRTDLIFYKLYTQIFSKLIDVIPDCINMYNNKTLRDGEERNVEEFLDRYQKINLLYTRDYATYEEKNQITQYKQNIIDSDE